MSTRPHLYGSIALVILLQTGVASAEQFRAAPARSVNAGAPRVIYGGFSTPRTQPPVRSASAPREFSFATDGPLDRQRTYFWDNRYHRWNGSAWVVIDSADLPPADPAPQETSAPAPALSQESAPAAAEPALDEAHLAAEVQQALAQRGYDPGPVDGQFGPQTRGAIISFQTDHGARGTGIIDGTLLQSLGLR